MERVWIFHTTRNRLLRFFTIRNEKYVCASFMYCVPVIVIRFQLYITFFFFVDSNWLSGMTFFFSLYFPIHLCRISKNEKIAEKEGKGFTCATSHRKNFPGYLSVFISVFLLPTTTQFSGFYKWKLRLTIQAGIIPACSKADYMVYKLFLLKT